ncbi:MAG: hypothetical protein LBQ46_05950 [Treponema sp.]|nr:hypothetical protein [Treponema sp.]
MKLDIVRADPAGNITIFVLNRIDDPLLRVRAAKALLAEPSLGAEQVGFVVPPAGPGALWRLDMMGGEFCGNAARSFGLYAARELGLKGKLSIPVSVSGTDRPVTVTADVEAFWAEAEIPLPRGFDTLVHEGRPYPVYFFEGITHVIAQDVNPGRDLVGNLLELAKKKIPERGGEHALDAFGVMFYEKRRCFIRPVVYVAAADSLVFESSCGSGTAALILALAGNLNDGEGRWEVSQPGGLIEGRVKKEAGEIKALSIGGPVALDSRRPVIL